MERFLWPILETSHGEGIMKRAILLLTRNSSHIFKDYIDSYKKYVDRDKYDLFLWDNGSREGDVEYLKTYECEGIFKACIFREENWLFTHAINGLLGLAKEMGNYEQYIIANVDIEFTENWSENIDINIDGIMGFLLVKPNGIIEHYGGVGLGDHFARGEVYEEGKYTEIRDCDWVTFGFVAIHKNVIDKCGGLDESFAHFGSDREYCKKAKLAGFSVKCSPSKLIHGFGKSTKPYIFSQVPDEIWQKHVNERHRSGVNFPREQFKQQRIDAPGRFLNLTR